MPETSPLHDLLVRLFSTDELRRWIKFGPGGAELVADIHWAQAHIGVVDAVISALERRGGIDEAFFDRLVEVRPGRRDEVEAVRVSWRSGKAEKAEAIPGKAPSRVPATEPTSASTITANLLVKLGMAAAALAASAGLVYLALSEVGSDGDSHAPDAGPAAVIQSPKDTGKPPPMQMPVDSAAVTEQPTAAKTAQDEQKDKRAQRTAGKPPAVRKQPTPPPATAAVAPATTARDASATPARWRVLRAERANIGDRIPTRLELVGPALERGQVLRLDVWDHAGGRHFGGTTRCRVIDKRHCMLDHLQGNPAPVPGDEYVLEP